MKFVALLLATVSADDAKILAGLSCKAEKAVCAEGLCCGTIKDADKATVLVKDVTAHFATVCSTKPTDKETDGAAYAIQAAAAEVVADDTKDPKVVGVAAKVKVDGTFTCNAAADADAASYMTVGAAAIIAAATLLQ